jgi:hypothetical protein
MRSIHQISSKDEYQVSNTMRLFAKHMPAKPDNVLFMNRKCLPLFMEMEKFRGKRGSQVDTVLIPGIHMFLEANKAFLWNKNSETLNQDNCRLKALALAGEVRLEIKHFADGSLDWLHEKFALKRMYEASFPTFLQCLETFIKDKRDDYYHQSAWVAGSHMGAILGQAQTLGLVMLNYLDLFGDLLHMYNMLHELDMIQEIPILEALCNLFLAEVFRGGRPDLGFFAVHHLYKGDRPESFKNKNVVWKKGQSTASIQPMAFSIFANHFLNLHGSNDEIWNAVFSEEYRKTNRMRGIRFYSRDARYKLTGAEAIIKIKEKLAQEFTGTLPIATTNFLMVFRRCVDTWKALEYLCYKLQDANGVEHGVRLHRSMLQPAQEKKRSGKNGLAELKANRDLLRMRDAILQVWEGQEVADYIWKNINI